MDEAPHPGEWFADPHPFGDSGRRIVGLSMRDGAIMGAAASLLSPWVGLFAGPFTFLFQIVYRFKRAELQNRADRMEGLPSPTNWLVRVECWQGPDTIVWTDIGGLALEGDRIVYASPATAFVLGGQDVYPVQRGTAFRLAAQSSSGFFRIVALKVDHGRELDRHSFTTLLVDFLNDRTPTESARQYPPLNAYRAPRSKRLSSK